MIEGVVADGLGEPAFLTRKRGLRAVVGELVLGVGAAAGAGCRGAGVAAPLLRRERSHHPSRLADDRDVPSSATAPLRQPRPNPFGTRLGAATAPSGASSFAGSSRSCRRRAVADSISKRAAPTAGGLISSR